MTSHKKTYFLPPNWDYPPPPAGPLQLGTIITHPITPSRSLNLEALQPIPRTFQNVKTDWEQTRSQIYEGRFGIWASFLQIVGIGGDIGFDKGAIALSYFDIHPNRSSISVDTNRDEKKANGIL